MEATRVCWGLYRDNGKENASYYSIGFRAQGLWPGPTWKGDESPANQVLSIMQVLIPRREVFRDWVHLSYSENLPNTTVLPLGIPNKGQMAWLRTCDLADLCRKALLQAIFASRNTQASKPLDAGTRAMKDAFVSGRRDRIQFA